MLRLMSRSQVITGLVSILLASTTLFGPSAAFAQQSAAGINGTIKDPSGATVAGATITLLNDETTVSRTSTSNSSGTYVFIDIPPASYTLKVALAGFNTITEPRVTLNVNQTATYDFTLSVGSTQQPFPLKPRPLLLKLLLRN